MERKKKLLYVPQRLDSLLTMHTGLRPKGVSFEETVFFKMVNHTTAKRHSSDRGRQQMTTRRLQSNTK